jgi:hypothetical protein
VPLASRTRGKLCPLKKLRPVTSVEIKRMITTHREEEKCIAPIVMKSQSSENQETPMALALEKIKTRMSDLRRIEYILRGKEFLDFYAAAPSKVEIDFHVAALDLESIERWIETQKSFSFDTMKITDLRELGRRKGIKMYNSLRKHELIEEIVRRSQ